MVETYWLKKLFVAFPNGHVNRNLEFVADSHRRVNSYFRLEDCKSKEDVAAKLLEWLSRDAYKSQHFKPAWRNKEVHAYHLRGINFFCNTDFSKADIAIIYQHLGNCVNHPLTLEFIRSGYDMNLLTRRAELVLNGRVKNEKA